MHPYLDTRQSPTPELVALLKAHGRTGNWQWAMKRLRAAADNCPACILAAIRQSHVNDIEVDEDGISSGPDLKFNYMEEIKTFWAIANNSAYKKYADACRYGY